MNVRVFGSFIAGIVACAGVMSGGFAMAGKTPQAPVRQVTVKFEWITTDSAGKRTTDSLVLAADDMQKAQSIDTKMRDGVETQQTAEVQPYIVGDKVFLHICCDVQKVGPDHTSAHYETSITVPRDETKVVKGTTAKDEKANSETLLFVTPSF